MQSYWIRHEGRRAVLDLREVPIPQPGSGQILLRVRASSLNGGDLLGAIAFHRAALGSPAGVDAAGEVHAVGDGVGEFSARVLEATGGRGVDLAVNLVGGTVFPACQKSLADFGRLAVVGYVDGVMKTELDLEAIHGKRLEIFGISNAPLTPAMRAAATRGFNRDFLPAIADGRIMPVVDRVFAFDELPAAKAYVEAGSQIGKVVVSLN